MSACVSRRGLKNQLRALLWLDVSLSFVQEGDTHNKLSMNSHNTSIVPNQLPRPQAWAREAVDLHGQEPLRAFEQWRQKATLHAERAHRQQTRLRLLGSA
ncbi:unnamed protein product [Pleuronectes platessa]|uniref:Uncharacterized protein n=1 Tax=Pleuronectes platessa TaxID=8262 RepID=A0A9N7TWW3_PLEPL|nr:unnamed protein product [Pleuronectes platessa]